MNSKKRVPTKERIKGLVRLWKNSWLFHWIDDRISEYYRRRLKNDHFTILCSNCVGGALYHRLGKQFLTPMINMFFSNPDFVEFCIHLDYYLQQKLTFVESDKGHPVAALRGSGEIPTITLYFNHDKLPEEAEEKWERRKTRIVRDNMYIMMYYLDGISMEQIRRLEEVPCKNRVIFTSKPLPEIPWSVYIKPIMSHRYPYNYLEKDMFGVRYLEKNYDFVSFFNS